MSIPSQVHERRQRTDRRRSDPHPITEDVADAITADELELLFQPQVCSYDKLVMGAEALVRWEHPDHGKLAGDALVAIAQSGGIARRRGPGRAAQLRHRAGPRVITAWLYGQNRLPIRR